MGPPEEYRAPVRLHDGYRWLGSFQEFTRVLPPEQAEPPLVLRGFAPGDRLRRALATGGRRALDLEEACLEIRDDRGEPLTDRLLWPRIRTRQPCEAVNGPGGYFGGCLDALADCLGGTFGCTGPATLLWRDAAIAREHLSRVLAPEGERYDLVALVREVLAEGGMHVTVT